MSKSFDISCAVPQWGRTLKNFLNKLKTFGADPNEIDAILSVMDRSKKRSSHQASDVLAFLREVENEAPPCFATMVDRKRPDRPYRLGFMGHEVDVNGVRLRVEGAEPHNGSSLIRLDEVDFTVVGLDELLSMTQHYLKDPTTVTKWGMYNYQLAKPTSIRVAGSAQLTSFNKTLQCEVQDMVGFFLISKPGRRKQGTDLDHLARSGQKVFVKGRYAGIVDAAYPGLKVVPVDDVEDAVVSADRGNVGIEIVQTGNTLREKGLILHGYPLFMSESLYVVDYDRYCSNKALRHLIKSLEPVGYFDEPRLQSFARWYHALEQNLGSSWKSRPRVSQLFSELHDIENGLRPYRLKTRYWKADDVYQRDAAVQTALKAQDDLEHYYQLLASNSQ